MVKESLIKKLMEMEIGELRERLAYVDGTYYVEEWVCDYLDDGEEIVERADDDICEECDVCDCCEDCETAPEGYEILEDDDEEDLAIDISNDIIDGLYSLSAIEQMGLYPQRVIDRIKYLAE